MTRYTLKPKLPMRAVVMIVFLGFIGAVLLVTNSRQPLHVSLVVLAVAALVVAAVFAAAVFLTMRTMAINVDIDDLGYEITGAGEPRRGTWDEVTKIASTPDGSRVVIAKGMIIRHYILAPGGAPDEQMAALIADMRARLESRALNA